jgi:phage baseplate assembly protein W
LHAANGHICIMYTRVSWKLICCKLIDVTRRSRLADHTTHDDIQELARNLLATNNNTRVGVPDFGL